VIDAIKTLRVLPRIRDQGNAMVLDLVPLWTGLLGLAVFYYVVFSRRAEAIQLCLEVA
jgi:hypothetical protein